jgi:putative membrane protein insertion efficiency factor
MGILAGGMGERARMKRVLLWLLRGYKRYVSPWLPPSCRFEPTCSVYMYQAIEKRGMMRGLYLGVKRVLKCHPFHAGGVDPVP